MDNTPTKSGGSPASAGRSGEGRSASAPTAVKSADRTVELLELLSRTGEPLTLSEIHRELSYPKSSLFVLLRSPERMRTAAAAA